MIGYGKIMILLLVGSMFIGVASSELPGQKVVEEMAFAQPVPADMQKVVPTKLEISPAYGNFRIKPGETKETSITIKNKDKKTISVDPKLVTSPYPGSPMIDESWLTITPASADIPAGSSQKFTIKTTVPRDASIGYYNLQIAITDEEMPTPYPSTFPNYFHIFSLSFDVWTPPKIQITPMYISDTLEGGKTYDYEINLKNTGTEAIKIDPRMGSDQYFGGPYGMMNTVLTEEDFILTAPKTIPAGGTEIVKVRVNVPASAKGYYNGWIDLAIDDPSVRDYEGRVSLNFNIWTQPTDPFVKSFTLKDAAALTIEISSNYMGNLYGSAMMGQGKAAKQPSFETSLEGTGKADLALAKKVIKGGVSLGGSQPPWEIAGAGIYQEMGTQYTETYTVNLPAGEWKLKVLPKNTESFEYAITIGG